MKSLLHERDRTEILRRLANVRADAQAEWGKMTAHQMICHVSDSMRAAVGEKYISSSSTLVKRTLLKWFALWVPLRWPHGVKTRPEMDQKSGGTPPVDFDTDVANLIVLFDRFCNWQGQFAPHGFMGPMSRRERMRHGYVHMDHHLRQFGA